MNLKRMNRFLFLLVCAAGMTVGTYGNKIEKAKACVVCFANMCKQNGTAGQFVDCTFIGGICRGVGGCGT